MEIYGRKILAYNDKIPVDFDELVLILDRKEIVVSLYRGRMDNRIEVRSNSGTLAVYPRAANVVEIRGAE